MRHVRNLIRVMARPRDSSASAAMPAPLLSLRRLTRRFGGLTAVDAIDLDLAAQEYAAQDRAHDAVGIHLGSASYGRRSAVQRQHGGFARGYLMRRYGILRSRTAPRAVVTEALVVAADALVSRDLAALRGRLAGVRAAAAWPRHPAPPPMAIEPEISFRHSLALRRRVYGGDWARADGSLS